MSSLSRLRTFRWFLVFALLLSSACGAQTADKSQSPAPDPKIHFPPDEGIHDAPVEWWYWTGHLQDEQARWYGFQLTFFKFGSSVQLTNAALTDIDGQVFHRGATFAFGAFGNLTEGFLLGLGDAKAKGANGVDQLSASFDSVGFDLDLKHTKPVVYQYGDGYHEYDIGGFTYYYSRPRMSVTGSITMNGAKRTVKGQAWFDHQWGDLQPLTDAGWDWFALQLDDGRDVMIFMLHGQQGVELVGGSSTDSAGHMVELRPDQVAVTSQGSWQSPDSSCTYPMGWQVELDGKSYTVTPALESQEFYDAQDVTRSYWEGASTVSGAAAGRAYVELTGYCPKP